MLLYLRLLHNLLLLVLLMSHHIITLHSCKPIVIRSNLLLRLIRPTRQIRFMQLLGVDIATGMLAGEITMVCEVARSVRVLGIDKLTNVVVGINQSAKLGVFNDLTRPRVLQ